MEKMSDLVESDATSLKVGTGGVVERIAATGAPELLMAMPQFPFFTSGANSSSTPSQLDRNSPTFGQVGSQGNRLFVRIRTLCRSTSSLGITQNLNGNSIILVDKIYYYEEECCCL